MFVYNRFFYIQLGKLLVECAWGNEGVIFDRRI